MSSFATVEDINSLWRTMTAEEQERANSLLPVVSDLLREEARRCGKDLDRMAAERESYANVVKLVTVDIVGRVLRQATSGEILSQESQGALGYTWSATYAIPGGGIGGAIMKNDLKRLGLRRQRFDRVRTYGYFCDGDGISAGEGTDGQR